MKKPFFIIKRKLAKQGVNVKEYSYEQMLVVSKAYLNGYSLEYFKNSNFTTRQLEEIFLGYKNNVDVKFYAKESFNWHQMRQIREGMELNINYHLYAKEKFSSMHMEILKNALIYRLDTLVLLWFKDDLSMMQQLFKLMLDGIDLRGVVDENTTLADLEQIAIENYVIQKQ